MIEIVYNLRDNPNSIIFSQDGTAIDFSGATRMVLKFLGSAIEADTDVDPTLIDYSQGSGLVVFDLGGLGIDDGLELAASLIVYDATHTDGQIIVHAEDSDLYFKFLDPI